MLGRRWHGGAACDGDGSGGAFWPDLILLLPATLLLTLLPVAMPTLWLVVSCYANAWLYCLFDALHVPASRAVTDDDESIDVDEAELPPPPDVFIPARTDRAAAFARRYPAPH